MKQHGRELLVGTVISLGIVIAIVGTLWLQGINWGRSVTVVEVWVRDAGGLMRGNPAVFRGVPIGRVANVAVDLSGAFVRVVVELEGEVVIDEESRGLISPQSLFGDYQLEIISLSRLPRLDYFEVPPGYHEQGVRVIGGYSVPDISRLTLVASDISENLASLTDRFDRAFSEETAEALGRVITNVEQLSTDVRQMIGQQAATFERVGADVERAANELSQAAVVGRTTLERFDNILARGDVDSVLFNLRGASQSVGIMVEDFRGRGADFSVTLARADTTMQALGRVVARLETGLQEGSIARLLDSPTLAANLEQAAFNLQALLLDIRQNPSRYIRLSIF